MRRIDLRRSDGVAMTEFALILPIFMVIVAGLLGFGRVFFYWIQANHLANETARWAVVDRNPYRPGRRRCSSTLRDSCDRRVQRRDTRSASRRQTATARRSAIRSRVTVAKPFTFVPILRIGTITIRGIVDDAHRELPEPACDPTQTRSAHRSDACT